MITEVVNKEHKVPPWSSMIPKRYKRNIINGELHRAKKIATDFSKEIIRIRNKFKYAGYPIRYINSVINAFNDTNRNRENVEDNKPEITVSLPFCIENENYSKIFMRKLQEYTQSKFKFIIIWKTKKVRSLFPLKDHTGHTSDIIYEGTCTCNNNYIGETGRNAELRWQEHNDIKKVSEPSKHLKDNPTHKFVWKILSHAPKEYKKRRILETYFIKIKQPSLNNQVQNYPLKLFHNGVT